MKGIEIKLLLMHIIVVFCISVAIIIYKETLLSGAQSIPVSSLSSVIMEHPLCSIQTCCFKCIASYTPYGHAHAAFGAHVYTEDDQPHN